MNLDESNFWAKIKKQLVARSSTVYFSRGGSWRRRSYLPFSRWHSFETRQIVGKLNVTEAQFEEIGRHVVLMAQSIKCTLSCHMKCCPRNLWQKRAFEKGIPQRKESETCKSQRFPTSTVFLIPQHVQADVPMAKQRLREGFAFVGLQEEWPLSICLFHAKFGGPACTVFFLGAVPRYWILENWFRFWTSVVKVRGWIGTDDDI